jgi:death-on-curing family protein
MLAASARVTSPGRPAAGSPPTSWPSWSRSRRRSRRLTAELKAMVLARLSRLMELPGVGPVVAARVLADVGDVARFADRNRFASWTGTAPLDASSGEQNRHRLSRAGNRRMNHMIHIAAVTQLRHDTDGRAYYRRKLAEGKTPGGDALPETPHQSDAIYRQLVADARAAAETDTTSAARSVRAREGTAGRLTKSSAVDLPPHIDTSDQPLPGPALGNRRYNPDAGLLAAAAARPQITVLGDDAYPSFEVKAAALLHSLVRNHALVDGNKRLAWSATRVFCLLNGRDLTYTVDEAEDLMLNAASGQLDVPGIAAWLAAHLGAGT